MKRLFLQLSLAVVFICGVASMPLPAEAQATPVTCTKVLASPGLWSCGSTAVCEPAYTVNIEQALTYMYSTGTPYPNAGSKLQSYGGPFYDFSSLLAYNTAQVQKPEPGPSRYAAFKSNQYGDTVSKTTSTTASFESYIVEDLYNGSGTASNPNYIVEHVVAHEVGHRLDHIYALAGTVNIHGIVVGGIATVGNTITVTIYDSRLTGGSLQVSYIVSSTSLDTVAQGIVSAFHHNSTLVSDDISASRASTTVEFTSRSSSTTFTISSNGGTESFSPETARREFSTSAAFRAALATDKYYMNKAPACAFEVTFQGQPVTVGAGIFNGDQDTNGNYICSGTNGDGDSLNAPYSGMASNIDIVNAAWPLIATDVDEIQELFAEEVASEFYPDTMYYEGPNAGQHRFGSDMGLVGDYLFLCTREYVFTLTSSGQLPTGLEFGGYKLPSGSGSAGGYSNDYTTHHCNGTHSSGQWLQSN